MTSWLTARLGRMRVSTVVLIVAFIALFWVYHNFEPRPAAPEAPPTAVVPPGFVPDPNYTWVPRTNVRRPKEPVTTTTTTTTTSPTETTDVTERNHEPDIADRGGSADGRAHCRAVTTVAPTLADAHAGVARRPGPAPATDRRSAGIAITGLRNRTATLACRDDHPRPCHQAVQVVGAARARQHLGQDRQG